ncbi:very-long-chain enoyl-CoA reductase-like [Pleurodeles waltl]|uniref:very-long-chain enoyl-CoA reductase-like n=1 Tax=Pleurodeles waltl TaxID=8319 RepID=UPI003709A960
MVADWMQTNFLKVSSDKMEVLVFSKRTSHETPPGGPSLQDKRDTNDTSVVFILNLQDLCDMSDSSAVLILYLQGRYNMSNSSAVYSPILEAVYLRDRCDLSDIFVVFTLFLQDKCDLSDEPAVFTSYLQDLFNQGIIQAMDSLAPARAAAPRITKKLNQPWFSKELKILQRKYRQKERCWKLNPRDEERAKLKSALKIYKEACLTAKSDYFTLKISEAANSSKELFKTINVLTTPLVLFFEEGKSLKDEDVLQNLPVGTTATLYFKDIGPQVAWTMLFLSEYAGPLFIYYFFYFRLPFVYGQEHTFTSSPHPVVNLACVCHSLHYVKRLIETVFIHRFSHGTMQLRRMLKNCLYYWGFAAWLAYYINHPLYTPASYGRKQITLAMIMFVICETGNFSINVALNTLRTNESRIRRIPYPTKNPFTWLFFFVSCPNYTYEVGVWISFSIMTQCIPVGLYTVIYFIQLTIWAKNKHCIYLKQFKDYPSFRMPIIPLFL